MNRPTLSVIIPAYNEEALIGKCLDSILFQTLDKKLYEVIVIDNASTDKTSEIARRYPVKLVVEPRKSVIYARQAGVDSALGDIIVSADADTIYPAEWLKIIWENFEKDSKLLAVTGWIYYSGSSPFFNVLNGFSQEINLFLYKYIKKFPVVYGANLAFKKHALEEIGGYPKHLVELGDQQYIVFKFFKLGKVKIDPKLTCITSGRKLESVWKNILIYNGWHRIAGALINAVTKKETIKATPTIRN